jgi:hypothetical protein
MMENQPTMDGERIASTIPRTQNPTFVRGHKKRSSWRPNARMAQPANMVTNTASDYKKNDSQNQVSPAPTITSRLKSNTNTSVLTPSNSTASTSCTSETPLTFRLPDDPVVSLPPEMIAAGNDCWCIDMDAVPSNGMTQGKLQEWDEVEEDSWKSCKNAWNHHRALRMAVILLLILVVILGTVVGVLLGTHHNKQVLDLNPSTMSSSKTNTGVSGHDDNDPLFSFSSSQTPKNNNSLSLETNVPTIVMTTEIAKDPTVQLVDSVAPGPSGGRNV